METQLSPARLRQITAEIFGIVEQIEKLTIAYTDDELREVIATLARRGCIKAASTVSCGLALSDVFRV